MSFWLVGDAEVAFLDFGFFCFSSQLPRCCFWFAGDAESPLWLWRCYGSYASCRLCLSTQPIPVAAPVKFERAYGFERHTHTAFDFRAEAVHAHILNGVAGAGVLRSLRLPVALRGYHRFGGVQCVFGGSKPSSSEMFG